MRNQISPAGSETQSCFIWIDRRTDGGTVIVLKMYIILLTHTKRHHQRERDRERGRGGRVNEM